MLSTGNVTFIMLTNPVGALRFYYWNDIHVMLQISVGATKFCFLVSHPYYFELVLK